MRYETLAERFVLAVLAAGARRARAHGLCGTEAEGCALDFTQHCLECERPLRTPGGRREPCERALIHTCADHFAADRARSLHRRHRREAPLPEEGCGSGGLASDQPGPEAGTLRDAFWELMASDLARLPTDQRDLIERHCLRGEPLGDTALTQGKSEDAVRMALSRALRRLRGVLLRQGHDAADLYEFLAPTHP